MNVAVVSLTGITVLFLLLLLRLHKLPIASKAIMLLLLPVLKLMLIAVSLVVVRCIEIWHPHIEGIVFFRWHPVKWMVLRWLVEITFMLGFIHEVGWRKTWIEGIVIWKRSIFEGFFFRWVIM